MTIILTVFNINIPKTVEKEPKLIITTVTYHLHTRDAGETNCRKEVVDQEEKERRWRVPGLKMVREDKKIASHKLTNSKKKERKR